MADMKSNDNIQITAQCLCKAHTFAAVVPRSSLPLQATACHCNSCRHATGAMYSNDVLWRGDHTAVCRSTLRKYDFSTKTKILFCATCSSCMFWEQPARVDGIEHPEDKEYGVFTGVLRNDGPEDLVRLTDHIFVGDTLDGGATMWLHKPNGAGGDTAKRWTKRVGKSEELPHDWPGKELPASGWDNDIQELSIQCHCKGVDFIYRQGQALEDHPSKQVAEISRYMDPTSGKPVVVMDACNSCRISFGVEFLNWTSASLRHIGFPSPGSQSEDLPEFAATLKDLYAAVSLAPDDRDPRLGTLAVFSSSEGVRRYFCSRCSACVFYAPDKRHDVVDVAMGLFHAPEGARAEGTFMWLLGGPVQNREDVVGIWREGWLKAVEAESEAWRK